MYRYNNNNTTENADIATVTGVGRDFVNVSGHSMLENVKMVLPHGICVLPHDGDKVIVMPLQNGEYIVLGTIYNGSMDKKEMLIESDSGAYIKLKNNGDVVINGLTISATGQIV